MPNWCDNKLTITGNEDKVQALYDACVGSRDIDERNDGLLTALRPMPEKLEGTDPNKDSENWYDWRTENWGSKWEVLIHGSPDLLDHGDGTYTLTTGFDSAWSPPVEAFIYYGENNPDVSIRLDYNEWGNMFCGTLVCDKGKHKDECYDYHNNTSKNVIEAIGGDLDDIFGISEMMERWEEDED